MSLLSKAIRRFDLHVAPRLPPTVAAQCDWRIGNLQSFGGPFNGQAHRRGIVRDLASAITFDTVIETGTFRGTSTEFLSFLFDAPVHTVENDRRFYSFALRRFADNAAVHVYQGDSRPFLRELGRQASTSGPTFFYLDAHWYDDLPLREELEIIRDNWVDAVVLVDDFEVFDDPGYAFDAYGSGRDLVLDYLPPLPGWRGYFPACPSGVETGARRGSIVLASESLDRRVAQVSSLRPVPGRERVASEPG